MCIRDSFSVVNDGPGVFNVAVLLIGVALLLSNDAYGIIEFKQFIWIALAALLILIGIRIIFEPSIRRAKYNRTLRATQPEGTYYADSDGKKKVNINFSSSTENFDGQVFEGADASVSFGEITLDLRGATFTHDTATVSYTHLDVYKRQLGILYPHCGYCDRKHNARREYRKTDDAHKPARQTARACKEYDHDKKMCIRDSAYTVPSRTGVNVAPDTWRKLASIPNIVGVKDATGDLRHTSRLSVMLGDESRPDSLAVYSGDDELTLPVLSYGGCGVISVVSNVIPGEMHELCHLFFGGKNDEALRLWRRISAVSYTHLFFTSNRKKA